MLRFIFTTVLSLLIISCSEKNMNADLILINGNIYTVDESNPTAEAIAIKGDSILYVGTNDGASRLSDDSTKVIDLKGKFVMPGFIESHAHYLGIGQSKINIDLSEAKNWSEIIYLVSSAAENARPGEWIIGRGWHQEKWDPKPLENVNGYPFHNELSRATPRNPVFLKHASGHAMFANQLAMELSGITDSTDNPNGGVIVRDSLGKAIGVFEEEAELLIQKSLDNYLSKRTEKEVQDDLIKEIDKATEECIKYGITSFHDAGSTFDEIDLYKKLADDNYFKVRLYLMLGESNEMLNKKMSDYRMIGYGNNFLTVRAIKKYSDGALGSRGAWILEPYDDLKYKIVDDDTSEYVGQSVTPLSELEETANLAVKNGFQLCTHAIGDKANREVLNLYEKFISQNQSNELRWRIEHAQHLNDKDIPRFGRLGVIAAMQPVHCTSDAVFVPKRLGNQRAEEGAYVWRNLLDANAVICSGTDAPVEKVNPFENIYSAVTRKSKDGTVFYPEQRMTREEALKSYTLNGAYAAFEEKIKGSITKGKLADIIVLSNDLMNCSEDEILSTEVLYTVVGGKIVYQKPESEE